MNINDAFEKENTINQVWRVSWAAYIPHALALAGLLVAMAYANNFTYPMIIIGVGMLLMCWVAYSVYYLSRTRLYIDDDGVWVFRGVFPWSRGVYGVKWRDIEDAVYSTNFIQWITKGYPVTLRPRFSNNPQIHTPPIHLGNKAVETINFLACSNESPTLL